MSDSARTFLTFVTCLAIAGLATGCNLNEVAADTTANFLIEAAPAVRGYFDYESAGTAAATGIVQLEGLHRVSPDNDGLTLTLAQAYVVYAFGWVMDEYEEAMFAGDYVRADHHQARAYNMYKRSSDLVFHLVAAREPEIKKLAFGDPDKLTAFLRERFGDRERDVELIFWWALTWGSTVTNAPSMDALIDFTAVKVVAAHAVFLDEAYENAGALAMQGGYESSYPEQLGGNWKKGRECFERAIKLSGRRNHLHLINFARTYAVNAQDKALFISLLREVIDTGDQGNGVRMGNKVARRRALRYLDQIDQWFE